MVPSSIQDAITSDVVRCRAHSGPLLWTAALLMQLLAAVPVLLAETPPLFDYPNHLSRVHVLLAWDRVAEFRVWFAQSSFLIPNVLSDLILIGLSSLVGVETAGRCLLVLIQALTLGGIVTLGRAATGRAEVWPLFGALLLHNEMSAWGFLNYGLGLAGLLWGMAAWLGTEGRSRRMQLALGAVAAMTTFAAHLVAFGLFAAAVAALEARWAWSTARARGIATVSGRLAASGAILLPPMLVFFLASPTGGLAPALMFDPSPFAKLSPYTRLLASGVPAADLAVAIPALVLLGGLAVAGRLTIDPRLGTVAGIFVLAQLLLPHSALGSYFLDARIAVAVALVAVAGLRSRTRAGDARGTRDPAAPATAPAVVLSALVVLVGLRSALLTMQWQAVEGLARPLLAALDRVPPGSLVVGTSTVPLEEGRTWLRSRAGYPPDGHVVSYATIRRDAVTPNIFAREGQNPLVFRSPVANLAEVGLPVDGRGAPPGPPMEQDVLDMIAAAASVRSDLDRVGLRHQALFVAVLHIGCRDWPADLSHGFGTPVEMAACGDHFSLIRIRAAGAHGSQPSGDPYWDEGTQ
ncbi:MAG TPA: hypothetical protein VEY95_14810 [Azospirillaceae bacterium]|nr:hypothetical protein [Azospirillaceae bacterium]